MSSSQRSSPLRSGGARRRSSDAPSSEASHDDAGSSPTRASTRTAAANAAAMMSAASSSPGRRGGNRTPGSAAGRREPTLPGTVPAVLVHVAAACGHPLTEAPSPGRSRSRLRPCHRHVVATALPVVVVAAAPARGPRQPLEPLAFAHVGPPHRRRPVRLSELAGAALGRQHAAHAAHPRHAGDAPLRVRGPATAAGALGPGERTADMVCASPSVAGCSPRGLRRHVRSGQSGDSDVRRTARAVA